MHLAAVVISTRQVFELKVLEIPECLTMNTHVLSDTTRSSSSVVHFVVSGEINQFKYLLGLDQTQRFGGCIHGAGGSVGSDKGLLSPSLPLPLPLPQPFLLGAPPLGGRDGG